MTWKQLHTKNAKLIKNYMDFLVDETSEFTYEWRLKLVTEIGRLQLQNEAIDAMTVEDYYKEIIDYSIKKTAS